MSEHLIFPEQAIKWGVSLLTKCNLNEDQARIVLKGLVTANLRGVDTHGLIMVRHYARRFTTIKFRDVTVLKDKGSTCLIDAGDNYGILASTIAMNKAIEKAEQYGTGAVSMRNSGHFGAASVYALMAVEKGMIGISMTNAGPRMPPFGGKEPFLGTNPFSVALPGREFPICLDMAFTTVANQKIITHVREGWPIPEGWALDNEGNPTTDPQKALNGMLTPLGGYKGACLSVMADLICSVISQNGFGADVQDIDAYDRPRKVGNFFIAINISNFLTLEAFLSMIDTYSQRFHSVPKKEGVHRLYLPGEIEYEKYKERNKNGFPMSQAAVDQLNQLADEFEVVHLV